ncbi:hypothetical protein D9758_016388 [Tetrapyrgos nigripes]|uniref:Uncharacterized protein n=1 Tax=Tetrapyrgos nigripes TaxID=182062 RepID=A0A8H5C917_9AGAR|nr:hypothetical protein D9758_016388 [Tetrapyrgos nigripes]
MPSSMAEGDRPSSDLPNPDSSFSFSHPVETSTVRYDRGDSYTTHRTHSTGSWVASPSLSVPAQEQLSAPSPATVRPSSGILGLHTTNPDPDLEAEYMNVPRHVSGIASGYRNAKIDGTPDLQGPKKKGFIGGFVRGLRRIPKAVIGGPPTGPTNFASRRRPSVGTDTFGSLPRYASSPPTPVAASHPRAGRLEQLHETPAAAAESNRILPPSLMPGAGVHRHRSTKRRPANHNIYVTPPQHSTSPTPHFPQPDLSGSISIPQQQPVGDGAEVLPSTSPHLTHIEVDDSQPHISAELSSRSRPSAAQVPLPDVSTGLGASLAVNPQPTPDYRRMSMIGVTSPASTISYDPSFTTELNGPLRFLSALSALPWVASGRITADYQPGLSRGGWGWKRIAVSIDKDGAAVLPDHHRHGERRRGKVPDGIIYTPVPKPMMSWYTGIPSNKAAAGKANVSRWLHSVQRDTIDLLSSGGSGSAARSSVMTGRSRSIPQTPTRERKRRSYGPGQKLYFAPNQFSFLNTDPKTAARVARRAQRDSGTTRTTRSERPTRHSTRTTHRHRERERLTSPSRATGGMPGMTPMYPHGYVPAASYQPNMPSMSMSSPLTQPAAPVYVLQTQSTAPLGHAANPGNILEQQMNAMNHSPSSVGAVPLLSPVYMQVVSGPPPAVPGDASPPGFAGRGAGGGYSHMPGQYPRYPTPADYPGPTHHGDTDHTTAV